ncbi:MAG: hypothetical protein NXI32_18165 [bacterium]|nr:hypothetical protein [bacterium]
MPDEQQYTRFRIVRLQAESRLQELMDAGLPREDAEREVIRWADYEHHVDMRVVEDAAKELPYTRLTGRVLWPMPGSRERPHVDDQLDILAVKAFGMVEKYKEEIDPRQELLLVEAFLTKLAAKHGIPAKVVKEYLGSDAPVPPSSRVSVEEHHADSSGMDR